MTSWLLAPPGVTCTATTTSLSSGTQTFFAVLTTSSTNLANPAAVSNQVSVTWSP